MQRYHVSPPFKAEFATYSIFEMVVHEMQNKFIHTVLYIDQVASLSHVVVIKVTRSGSFVLFCFLESQVASFGLVSADPC